MTLALTFVTPLLLLGLAAAAIPVVLHLLASVRAPQVYFPTLRFLKMGMEKTARRRRLEHWLLLLIRSALLAALALAVAEPVLRSTAGFWADKRFAAVIIVDNSWSMGVRRGGESRFDRARREAGKLLGGQSKPGAAAVILTNSAGKPDALRSDLEVPRRRLSESSLASGRAAIAEHVRKAVSLLEDQSAPQKAIYVFSDLQRISFRYLAELAEIAEAGIPLMLVDCSDAEAVNVGIEDLRISGSRIVGRDVKFTAALINSSPTDKEVHVWLQVDGRDVGERVRKILPAFGEDGPTRTTVEFRHCFDSPGVHVGQVAVSEADDLGIDNVRRFSLEISGHIRAVLVSGGGVVGGAYDPAWMLQVGLESARAWSIKTKTLSAGRFGAKSLAGAQAVFFADVPSFTVEQAQAVIDFIRGGGSAVFFLGPAAKAKNYNERFAGVLPGRIGKAVGQVGLDARAVTAVRNLRHKYLAGLYETPADYPEVIIQRYYRLEGGPGDHETILSTPAGEPIISERNFGSGRMVLSATTASREWNNFATSALFLPMMMRICFTAGERLGGDNNFVAGDVVKIRPRAELTGKSAVNVTMPDGTIEVLTLGTGPAGPVASFAKTDQPGIYRWKVVSAGRPGRPGDLAGAFAVNPDGAESDLVGIAPTALAGEIKQSAERAGLKPPDVYFGKTLDEVHAAAADAAAGDNLWDRLLAVVILLLVVEAVLANRLRRGAEPTPAHLNPSLAA